MLYLGMGALVFVTLETPKESAAHKELLKTKQDFLINNSCVTEVDFHKLLKVLSDTQSKPVPLYQPDPDHWFFQYLFLLFLPHIW